MKNRFTLTILCVIFVIFLCGCDTVPREVKMCKIPFSAELKVKVKENTHSYNYSFSGVGNCNFVPHGLYSDIAFCWKNDTPKIRMGDIEYTPPADTVALSPIAVIKKIIERSVGETTVAETGGKYIIYGNTNQGEYRLQINEYGFPVMLTMDALGIRADFTNQKINGG